MPSTNPSRASLEAEIRRALSGLAPPPDLTVSEWAEAERVVSGNTAAPGPWRNDKTPYLVEVMDAFTDPRIERVVMMTAARVGKTSVIENVIGYHIAHDPCALGVYFGNADDAALFGRKQIGPMCRDTPSLAGKIVEAVGNKAGSTEGEKLFPGGSLELLSAGSSADLRMRTFRVVLLDEVDVFPRSVVGAHGGEGDPVSLAVKRVETAEVGKKIGLFSSPTIAGQSLIEREFLAGDRRRWHVPCPHCRHEQVMRWKNVIWNKEDDGAGGERWIYNTARYACESCGQTWTEQQRREAVRRGRWIAEAPTEKTASFHLSTLCSLFVTLEGLVRDWEKAVRGGHNALQVFLNTTLGETWAERYDETLTPEALAARREDWGEGLPDGVALLTMGVDVQSSPPRLEYEIVGWGRDEESWSAAAGVIEGDPAAPIVWRELDAIRTRRWRRHDGRVLAVEACCVDSGGHYTDAVYRYAAERRAQRVWAVKGASDSPGRRALVWPSMMSAKGKAAGKLWIVGAQAAKDAALSALSVAEPGPRFCHFPHDRDLSWFDSLLGEERVMVRTSSGEGWQWRAKRGKRTEAADCRAYAYVGLASLRSLAPTLVAKSIASTPAPGARPAAVASTSAAAPSEGPGPSFGPSAAPALTPPPVPPAPRPANPMRRTAPPPGAPALPGRPGRQAPLPHPGLRGRVRDW
jgi:phage terminase large subunit GpA-like protein